MDWAQSLYKPCRGMPRSNEEWRKKWRALVYSSKCIVILHVHRWQNWGIVMSAQPNGEHTLAHLFFSEFLAQAIPFHTMNSSLNYARFCSYRCSYSLYPSHSVYHIYSLVDLLFRFVLLTLCAGAQYAPRSFQMQIVSVCFSIEMKASISITKNMAIT